MRQDGGLQQVQTATGPLCLRSARSRSTSASEGRPNAQARKGPVGSGATGTGEASPGASKARPARKPAERAAGKAADSAARNAPDSAAGTGPDVSLSLDASPNPDISFVSSVSPSLQAPISPQTPISLSLHVPSFLQVPPSSYMPCPFPCPVLPGRDVLPQVEVWPMPEREHRWRRLSKPTVGLPALLFIIIVRQCLLPH